MNPMLEVEDIQWPDSITLATERFKLEFEQLHSRLERLGIRSKIVERSMAELLLWADIPVSELLADVDPTARADLIVDADRMRRCWDAHTLSSELQDHYRTAPVVSAHPERLARWAATIVQHIFDPRPDRQYPQRPDFMHGRIPDDLVWTVDGDKVTWSWQNA